MTLENLKIHHARLKWLASGEFTERDFDFTIDANENPNGKQGEKGWTTMGDMNSERRQLIMGDAKLALERFEAKYPSFKKPEPEEEEEEEEEEKPKSKEKK